MTIDYRGRDLPWSFAVALLGKIEALHGQFERFGGQGLVHIRLVVGGDFAEPDQPWWEAVEAAHPAKTAVENEQIGLGWVSMCLMVPESCNVSGHERKRCQTSNVKRYPLTL